MPGNNPLRQQVINKKNNKRLASILFRHHGFLELLVAEVFLPYCLFVLTKTMENLFLHYKRRVRRKSKQEITNNKHVNCTTRQGGLSQKKIPEKKIHFDFLFF
jgi:hypothetical protein